MFFGISFLILLASVEGFPFDFFGAVLGLSSSHSTAAAHDFHMFLQLFIAQFKHRNRYTHQKWKAVEKAKVKALEKAKMKAQEKAKKKALEKAQEQVVPDISKTLHRFRSAIQSIGRQCVGFEELGQL